MIKVAVSKITLEQYEAHHDLDTMQEIGENCKAVRFLSVAEVFQNCLLIPMLLQYIYSRFDWLTIQLCMCSTLSSRRISLSVMDCSVQSRTFALGCHS